MKTQTLTNALLKISDIQTEVLYFIEKYGNAEKLPWEKYFEKLYVDFNIILSTDFNENDKKTFIGLSIIDDNYDLYPSTHARSYYFNYNGETIDQFDYSKICDHIVHSAAKLVVNLYHAEQKNETEMFYKWLQHSVDGWNNKKYVLQEQVLNLSLKYSISEISEIIGSNDSLVYKIIQDATNRIDKSLLENLQNFYHKVSLVIEKNPELKEKISFIEFILKELKNGGKNINKASDLLPQFNGLILN